MHRAATLSDAEREGIINQANGPDDVWEQDDSEALLLGIHFCGITLRSAAHIVRTHALAETFLADWRAKGRTVPMVRVGTTLLFEARDGKGISYRDFATLCAVNAALGKKPFAAITQPRIRAGMLGYSSSTWLFDEEGNLTRNGESLLQEREDGAVPLSRKQMRTTLDRLERRHFFARFLASPRRTFFSRSLTNIELAKELLRREEAVTDNRRKMNDLREQIRQVKAVNRTLNRAKTGPVTGPQTGPLNAVADAATNAAPNAANNPRLQANEFVIAAGSHQRVAEDSRDAGMSDTMPRIHPPLPGMSSKRTRTESQIGWPSECMSHRKTVVPARPARD